MSCENCAYHKKLNDTEYFCGFYRKIEKYAPFIDEITFCSHFEEEADQ